MLGALGGFPRHFILVGGLTDDFFVTSCVPEPKAFGWASSFLYLCKRSKAAMFWHVLWRHVWGLAWHRYVQLLTERLNDMQWCAINR